MDDVFTSGKSKREALDQITRMQPSVVPLAVAAILDRQERVSGSPTEITQSYLFTQETGIPVISLVKASTLKKKGLIS